VYNANSSDSVVAVAVVIFVVDNIVVDNIVAAVVVVRYAMTNEGCVDI
jgi:hypothetical protein